MNLLLPYETRPGLILVFVLVAGLYGRGLYRRRCRADILAAGLFYAGLLLLYLFTQTSLDYVSRYVFFMHRLQHLVLHHIGPFLIALAGPGPVLAAGLSPRVRELLRRMGRWPVSRGVYRLVQQPVIAGLLFVGLIGFWLWPPVHFHAMLSSRAYWTMNLSMIVDGLLFWWLVLDPRPPAAHPVTPSIAARMILLWAVMIGQIMIAAPIALADHEIFTAYSVCGRAWPIAPLTDQQLGGLITWIPAAMMSVIGMLILLAYSFRHVRERTSPSI